MKLTEQQKQYIQACATATGDTTAILAAAGTLCIYAGAVAIDNGVVLLVSSATAGELVGAYTQLASELLQGDMYDVEYTEPVEITLPKSPVEFGSVLQDFSKRLLLLRAALRNLHLSYTRSLATDAALVDNRGDPQGAEYQDARLFYSLHRQAIWRNLALCKRLHEELLFSTPRVNMLWHHYKLQLPQVSRLSDQNVEEVFTNIWQERSSDIAAYQLTSFNVNGFTSALQVIKQKGQLIDPSVLLDEQWHKAMQQLMLSFQQALDDFYR